ncbi:hypothetical protein EIP86_004648 [Pleurotus ostreatoroseus]|nr:hypothetical protein EIP86_004648 [Pleurotus ostreatoroseus]
MTVLPDGHADLDLDFVSHVPYGCPNDPSLSTLSDEEVFAICKRHADFDRYTLSCSSSAVLQFLRWKERILAHPHVPMEGVTLSAKSGAFSTWRRPFTPRYALEPLPDITTSHLRVTQRTTYPDFVNALQESVHFTIILEQELTPPIGTKFARTFVCRILQIDSQKVMVPYPHKLCVKLYDDSTGKVDEFQAPGDTGRWRLGNFYTDMDMLQNEDDFTCPDNQQRYGMLMELVPKITKPLSSCSESAQIAFIESARHAVRVLQYADVTQYDWSNNFDQIIVTPLSDTSSTDSLNQALSCTLVDFGLARQGSIFYDVEKEDDYAGMAWVITMHDDNKDGIPPALVEKYYGPRERWDFLAYKLPF